MQRRAPSPASTCRRPDELYFCRQVCMIAFRLRLLISCYLQSDDERIQPQSSQSSQRTHRDFLSGYIGDI
jgi:hypothetical protein